MFPFKRALPTSHPSLSLPLFPSLSASLSSLPLLLSPDSLPYPLSSFYYPPKKTPPLELCCMSSFSIELLFFFSFLNYSIREFLGAVGYCCLLIPRFAEIVRPLVSAMAGANIPFKYTVEG